MILRRNSLSAGWLWIFLCACAPAVMAQQTIEFSARVAEVLEVSGGGWNRRTRLLLRVEEGVDHPFVIWEDGAAVRCVEDAHEVLFDDFLGSELAGPEIRLRVRGCDIVERPGQVPVVGRVEAVNPSPHEQDEWIEVQKLDPPAPAAGRTHRYVQVPVSYARPEYGTFRLYYEVNEDFDLALPTLMFPADGQVTASTVGRADAIKKNYRLAGNVVTYQYRGTFCSAIPQFDSQREIDWEMAWNAFNIDNAVEDIDRIRADLLGPEGKMNLYAGSGMAVLSLAYLSKYHRRVDRAFLMSFFTEARASCDAAIAFFQNFLRENRLEDALSQALKRQDIEPTQLFFVLQRLLYSNQAAARELLLELAEGERSAYDEESARAGSFDYFVRSMQRNWPHAVVFMYETNVPTSRPGEHDVNEAFLKIGNPIDGLVAEGRVQARKLDIRGLDQVSTEVLVVSGTLDQVTPVSEQEKVHRLLPNARHAIFRAYHCLEDQRECRRELLQVFLRDGLRSPGFERVLRHPKWRDLLAEVR
ncbi:MAG: alpha/beta fold hydrolase [Armatimonadetes bacterium]|nr:alpha/beta fold hydrolase [Armatimonadota bacterium]